MASLAELYLPFVAVVQFLLAATIVWLARASTRAIVAAVILVANGLQGLALMAYNTKELFGTAGPDAWVPSWTGLTTYQWVVVTELLIAIAVGVLGWSLVRNLGRRNTLVGLVVGGLVLPYAYLRVLVPEGGGTPGLGIALSHAVAFVFAISLAVVCMLAVPHVIRMRPTSERVHAFLLLAAVLVPMAQQHLNYLIIAVDRVIQGAPPDRFSEWLVLWGIGLPSAVFLGWALWRLGQAARRERGGPAFWLGLAVIGSIVFALLRVVDAWATVLADHVPSATQVFAQLIRPSLLVLAFARFEFVRLPRGALRPLSIAVSALIGFSMFAVVQFVVDQSPYHTEALRIGPAMIGLALAAVTAGVAVPKLVRATDEMALELDAGGRGRRLERYQAAMAAKDPDLRGLQSELGISQREHEALESVLAGNLVIPEMAARGLRVGDRLEGYTVIEVLGQGGQGIAVRARDRAGHDVVIKQVRDAWADGAKQRIAALRREAVAGRSAGGPRAIVETPFAVYLVRDFVPGKTLAETPDVDAERVRVDVSRQLADMHARGWSHGDVKPSNIIIRPDGAAVLIDEGAARALDDDVTVDLVSTRWAAPEQFRGDVSPASDVYQLGMALRPYARRGDLLRWVEAALQSDAAARPSV